MSGMANNNAVLGGGGFHHVAIKVVNFEEAVAFYKNALGFQEKITWGEGDKRAVMLDTGDGNYLEIFAGGKAETPSEGRIIHFAIRTTDTDAAQARAIAAGAVETMAPKSVTIPNPAFPVPVRISFVRTPSGELVEFFQNELT
jgi:glyoxylase I family protein